MAREPDMIVRLVGDGEQPDQVVAVVGDQVITATPGDVGKVVTVAADGTLTLAAAAGGASDHGDLTGLSDDDHPYLLESAVSAFGLTVLDDANAAAVRTTLVLGNVDNTADANKPVSTAQQTALDLKAPLASPALTGNPTAPTPSVADNDTSIATTAYVQTELDAYVPIADGNRTVVHGSTAGTARPTGYATIQWIGSVEPTNAVDNDTWVDTT